MGTYQRLQTFGGIVNALVDHWVVEGMHQDEFRYDVIVVITRLT